MERDIWEEGYLHGEDYIWRRLQGKRLQMDETILFLGEI